MARRIGPEEAAELNERASATRAADRRRRALNLIEESLAQIDRDDPEYFVESESRWNGWSHGAWPIAKWTTEGSYGATVHHVAYFLSTGQWLIGGDQLRPSVSGSNVILLSKRWKNPFCGSADVAAMLGEQLDSLGEEFSIRGPQGSWFDPTRQQE